jgi:hypothetical protein
MFYPPIHDRSSEPPRPFFGILAPLPLIFPLCDPSIYPCLLIVHSFDVVLHYYCIRVAIIYDACLCCNVRGDAWLRALHLRYVSVDVSLSQDHSKKTQLTRRATLVLTLRKVA